MSPFAESEIDSLVGEVGDVPAIEETAPAVPVAAVPLAAAPAAEEGAWMGSSEDEDTGSFADPSSAYGSSVPLEDLLEANETAAPEPAAVSSPSAAAEPAWRPESHGGEFQVDRGFDPEWAQASPTSSSASASAGSTIAAASEPSEESVPIAPFPLPTADEIEDPHIDEDVRLTEVASDEDLFTDPSLEIAHLVVGQTREIMVPVMLGEGATAGRFKLAIRLRLEPVD